MTWNEQFIRIALTLAGFASVSVWALAVREWTQGGQPLPLRKTPAVRWDQWTVLASFAIWGFVDWIAYYTFDVGPDSVLLERIKATCFVGGPKIVLLIVLLQVTGDMRLRDLLPDRGGIWEDLKTGVWGFLASLLPVWGVSELIRPLRTEENGHPFIIEIKSGADPATLAWIALAVVIVAPLLEELIFRVILQGWLQDRVSPVTAVVAVAVGFAAVHLNAWPDPLPLIPLSLVLGYIYYRRRSYLANVVMHALFNGLNLLMALSVE